ncbi:MAG TPA: glycosyltransferase family 2 protein [Ilumatobacter sp.]|nr:glycosyltransferase family 2 protein [Ilumatobacter sp.]
METDLPLAPSVVSVMVVHEPGDWFDDTLAALAAQDYPNLRTLFLVTPTDDATFNQLTDRIRSKIPSAFVRHAPANDGFGTAVNEVLRLVEGDNGLFLVCHDDIAPASDAVRMLAAELFRSNAGIVGPKLVEWDQPRVLQHVGLGLDRFGEVDSPVDEGEVDQEQHDAVRDVFVVPSACFLVRADLFRTLGGFDPQITFYGDDVDLCWRAHHTGARVIVAPDAVVRHREQLADRRPGMPHRTLQARHRMRTVATLTGASRLIGRSFQMVLLTLAELIVGLFSGRFGEAVASLRGLVGLVPRTPRIVARRRHIRAQRAVPEREVLGLQNRGSARLTSYLRGRDTATFVGEQTTVRRWRQASFGPPLAWFTFLVAVVVGGRNLIRHGVPAVGEFLPFPAAGDLWSAYGSSFDPRGFGATAAAPTGWVVAAVLSVVTWFRMPLFQTVTVVGLHVLGGLGAWRLAAVFPVNRARIVGMVVYVGTPLVPGLLQTGNLSGLVWFAALPWLVHETRLAAGLATADPFTSAVDLTDGVADPGWRARLRALAIAALTLGVAVAFVPVTVLLWLLAGLLVAGATLLAGGAWRVAAWIAGCTVATSVVGVLLNLPWALDWTWEALVGAPPAGSTGRSLATVASLAPNLDRFAVLAVALYVPVLAALAICRAWRFTWAVRGTALVLVFGALMVFAERGSFDVAMPAPALLAVPVALGLALAAASIAGGFGDDVRARGFGWRQPMFVLAHAALALGVVPAVVAIGDGSWHIARTPLPRLYSSQFPIDTDIGDYRVLFVGDPRTLPVPAREYADGIAFAVVDAGPLNITERFATPVTAGDDEVVEALELLATGSTLRAGQLLAPLGIRFVVVPLTNGSTSTVAHPIAQPDGLVEALVAQLDLGVVRGQPSLSIFLNRAWFPVGAQLTGATAEASRQAGAEALVRADLSHAVPSMAGIDARPEAANEVAPGAVHVAIPYDPRLSLRLDDGTTVAGRPGFGVTTAFDIERGGVGRIGYQPDESRRWWLAAQGALWLSVVGIAAAARTQFGRRRTVELLDETLIDLGPGDLDDLDEFDDLDRPARIAGEALVAPSESSATDGAHDHDDREEEPT